MPASDVLLSTPDLQDAVRVLTNGDLYRLTKLSNPTSFPVLRAALLYYATTCGYTYIKEDVMYENFMYDVRVGDTMVRTIIGPADKAGYVDTFNEHSEELPPNAELLYCTQIFSDREMTEYIGAWLTVAYHAGSDQWLAWIAVDNEWNATIMLTIQALRGWATGLSKHYYFVAYGVLDTWPRIMVGDNGAEQLD